MENRNLKQVIDQTECYKKENPELWNEKLYTSAKRVLSSLIFYVSGKSAFESNNKLLPAIAYYYSIFHLSKALLFILPHRDLEKDKGISHKKVINLIDNEFIKQKLLDKDYIIEAKHYLNLRALVNYKVDSLADLDISLTINQANLETQIKKGVIIYRKLCIDDLHYPRAVIGDGIGDDLCQTYLSKREQEELWNLALKLEITT